MDMKIAEIREIATNELAERIQTEVANYNQMVLNHSISPLENPAQIKSVLQHRNFLLLLSLLLDVITTQVKMLNGYEDCRN